MCIYLANLLMGGYTWDIACLEIPLYLNSIRVALWESRLMSVSQWTAEVPHLIVMIYLELRHMLEGWIIV